MKTIKLTLHEGEIPVYYDFPERKPNETPVGESRVFRSPWNTTCAALRLFEEPYFWVCPSFHANSAGHEAYVMRDVNREAQQLLDKGNSVEAIMVGRSASLLFTALTGRHPGICPDEAMTEQAHLARKTIRELAENDEGYALAQGAVEAFGEFIQPWLATTKLDEDGRIIRDDPCYETRIPLA